MLSLLKVMRLHLICSSGRCLLQLGAKACLGRIILNIRLAFAVLFLVYLDLAMEELPLTILKVNALFTEVGLIHQSVWSTYILTLQMNIVLCAYDSCQMRTSKTIEEFHSQHV